MVHRDLELMATLAASDGVAHRRALRALGVSAKVEARLVERGVLDRAAPSVVVVRALGTPWVQQVRIALAQAGPGAVVSHGAAAVLWNLPRLGRGAVELTVPRDRGVPRGVPARLHRSRIVPVTVELDPNRATSAGATPPMGRPGRPSAPIPVTSPERTIVDLGARLRAPHLAECIYDLARRELLTVERLRQEVERLRRRGRAGVPRVAAIVADVQALPRLDSYLEARVLRLIDEAALPRPETQAVVSVDGRTYRVDLLWRAWRLIVEVNGYATHAGRRELSQDAERSARLQAAGYEVVSFTFDQVVGDPRYVVAQIGRRLARPPQVLPGATTARQAS